MASQQGMPGLWVSASSSSLQPSPEPPLLMGRRGRGSNKAQQRTGARWLSVGSPRRPISPSAQTCTCTYCVHLHPDDPAASTLRRSNPDGRPQWVRVVAKSSIPLLLRGRRGLLIAPNLRYILLRDPPQDTLPSRPRSYHCPACPVFGPPELPYHQDLFNPPLPS